MAAAAASGGLGCARRREEERPEEGARQRKEGKVRGGRPHLLGVQVDSGEASQREAGGGTLGRVRSLSLCLLAVVGDDWQVARWAGPASGRTTVAGKAQVLLSFSLISLFYFV